MLLCNRPSRQGLLQQQKYVAMNSKCCQSSSAVSEMAEEMVRTNGWALKQANVYEKFPFSRMKILLCCAILINTNLNTILQGQAGSQ